MMPAKRLKDVDLSLKKGEHFYREIVLNMCLMYKECKLVHADFSEYNILVYNDQLYFINVSQSVETDHPMVFEFLKRDCININNFFSRIGIHPISSKSLFYFIIKESISCDDMENSINLMIEVSKKQKDEDPLKFKILEKQFKEECLPKGLGDYDMNENENNEERNVF